MNVHATTLVLLCGLSIGHGAVACSPPILKPGEVMPTSEQRLAEAPLAFVGHVVSTSPGTATSVGTAIFVVEKAVRGTTAGARVEVQSGGSTCMASFGIGTRWLYAGSDANAATIPIIPETLEVVRSLVPGLE